MINYIINRIVSHQLIIGIICLEYDGLSLAITFANSGFRVLGFDSDLDKVNMINTGRSYIRKIPDDTIRRLCSKGFEATSQIDRLGEPDTLLICVPTPLTATRGPDLSYVIDSASAIAKRLRPGQLVVLESSTYPGTTRQVVLPVLERARLRVGHDFFLAYSPKREGPENSTHVVTTIPKVVGGVDGPSSDVACELYAAIVPDVVRVSSPEIAEACKILESTYRTVNIALVNELKILYDRMGIDIWEVIDAAKTKPFGFEAFYPGPGLGGHSLPSDPFYLTWVARQHRMNTRFVELAGEVNAGMPSFVVGKVADALNDAGRSVKGSKIAILGMAYKRDVDDARGSPGFELMSLLLSKGGEVTYHDPHILELPRMRQWPHLRMATSPLTADYLRDQDCVLIATDHSAYDYDWIVSSSRLVVDTRNATRAVKSGRDKIVRA